MNKRLLLKNSDGEPVYCILSAEEDRQTELEKVFSIQKGYGFSVEYTDREIRLVDYFHGETRARFTILSTEDTEEPVLYRITSMPE